MSVQIRGITPEDRPWVDELLTERWGSPDVVSRGRVHDASRLPGFTALDGDHRLGLATYAIDEDQ